VSDAAATMLKARGVGDRQVVRQVSAGLRPRGQARCPIRDGQRLQGMPRRNAGAIAAQGPGAAPPESVSISRTCCAAYTSRKRLAEGDLSTPVGAPTPESNSSSSARNFAYRAYAATLINRRPLLAGS